MWGLIKIKADDTKTDTTGYASDWPVGAWDLHR